MLVVDQNLHICTGGNTLHFSRIVGYVLNRGQTKTNKTRECISSMNDTDTTKLGYVFSPCKARDVIPRLPHKSYKGPYLSIGKKKARMTS